MPNLSCGEGVNNLREPSVKILLMYVRRTFSSSYISHFSHFVRFALYSVDIDGRWSRHW